MSVSTTRLLLLGAVGLFEPVNGYQIRRELMSWRVDAWASIKPGSIYHGLGRLAEQGLLADRRVADGARAVVVYELTADGRAVLEEGIVAAIVEVNVFDRHDFQAAFGLLPLVGTARAGAALRVRRDRVVTAIAEIVPPSGRQRALPTFAVRSLALWRQLAVEELAWLDDVLADLDAGTLEFEKPVDMP